MNDVEVQIPPLKLGRTLKFAVRETWDALGLVCSVSFTLFVAIAVALMPFLLTGRFASPGARLIGLAATIMIAIFLMGPLVAGACRIAFLRQNHEEASYWDLLDGFRRYGMRAVGLAGVQVAVTMLGVVNAVFYGARGGLPFLALSAVFIYALVFWGMNCLYHFPLLVAASEGVIKRDDGGQPRMSALMRNGFLLAAGAPGYSFALLVLIIAIAVPLAISGVGVAMFLPGFAAFLTMTATRDHLVRHGLVPPPFDPDTPVDEDRWRVHLQ